jgi:hypothetical protein
MAVLDASTLRLYWLAMARRFWIGFYCFAFVVLGGCLLMATVSLAVWRFPLREVLEVFIPFQAMLSWIMWLTFDLLRRELTRGK